MMLKELFQGVPIKKDVAIRGITQDSRKVEKGFLFVAIAGHEQDGHRFIPEAVRKGAAALVVTQKMDSTLKVPVILVKDSRKALAEVAARFYKDPSEKMRVIGVTGTNGKTTITYLMESVLTEAGRRPAVLGTINYRYGGKVRSSGTTTPESVDLQRFFAHMLEEGVTDVVMEVSSHALVMERIRGVHFDAAIFTNLSQDHLDFHKDLEDYFQSKLKLFTELLPDSRKKNRFAVLNMEDPRSEIIFQKVKGLTKIRTGLTGPYEVSCQSFQLSEEGIQARVKIGAESVEIRSKLLGRFNLENILVVMAAAQSLGVPMEAIVRGLEKMTGVPGRLERIPNDRGIHLFVDYAHTPEALAGVGETLRKISRGRIITVFGCGGDRDRSKRPLMGREAALFSDLVVVTSDNPRSEEPEAIIDEILPGLHEVGFPEEKIFRICSREEALSKAVKIARRGDLILVAGKGHEDYQIIGKKKTHFSDQEILRKLLQ